jgi:hypothetical protein
LDQVFFRGEILPNFNLHIKDFLWEKNGPNLPDFENKNKKVFQIARVL